jgi:hypothetical protein
MAKFLTTGIHGVFRGSKLESEAEIGQNGGFSKVASHHLRHAEENQPRFILKGLKRNG